MSLCGGGGANAAAEQFQAVLSPLNHVLEPHQRYRSRSSTSGAPQATAMLSAHVCTKPPHHTLTWCMPSLSPPHPANMSRLRRGLTAGPAAAAACVLLPPAAAAAKAGGGSDSCCVSGSYVPLMVKQCSPSTPAGVCGVRGGGSGWVEGGGGTPDRTNIMPGAAVHCELPAAGCIQLK
jgi:hypothetical protein